MPIIRQMQASGLTTLRQIVVEALNARGIRSARGGIWHTSMVRDVLARGKDSP